MKKLIILVLALASVFLYLNLKKQRLIQVGDAKVRVEIMEAEAQREKGLSDRKSLCSGCGMLFVFDSKQVTPIFWMKDMVMPIDIIWISGDKIVKIDKSAPIPKSGVSDGKLPKYSPGRPIDYVLEVSSGFSDTNNIKVGDVVQMQFDPKQS